MAVFISSECSELRVISSPNIQKKSGKYAFDTRIKTIDFIIKLHTYGPSGSFQAPSVHFKGLAAHFRRSEWYFLSSKRSF